MAILAAEHESDIHFGQKQWFDLVPCRFLKNGAKMAKIAYFIDISSKGYIKIALNMFTKMF